MYVQSHRISFVKYHRTTLLLQAIIFANETLCIFNFYVQQNKWPSGIDSESLKFNSIYVWISTVCFSYWM